MDSEVVSASSQYILDTSPSSEHARIILMRFLMILISAMVALCATPGQSTLTAEQTVSRDQGGGVTAAWTQTSCIRPGPSCQACTNPAYFKCSGSCLHPDLVCDGRVQCSHGEDEAWERCHTTYRARGIDWRRYIWNIINSQYVWSRNGTLLQ